MNFKQPDLNKRKLNRLIALDQRCKIAYLIPHFPQSLNEASSFGWYGEGLHDAAEPLLSICKLPADIREPHTDSKSILPLRLLGIVWPLVTPVETTSLLPLLNNLHTPFRVLFSTTKEIAEFIDEMRQSSKLPILHISSIRAQDRILLHDVEKTIISKYVTSVLDIIAKDPDWADFARGIRQVFTESKRRKSTFHPLRQGLHNVTLPNELALESFGRKFKKSNPIAKPISEQKDPKTYINRICLSADAVSKERTNLLGNNSAILQSDRYVLAAPSIYWGYYRRWRHIIKSTPQQYKSQVKSVLKNLVRPDTYFDRIALHDIQKMEQFDGIFFYLMSERKKDLRSFTATLASISSSTLTPVLRLEPKVNNARVQANELARCVRANAKHQFLSKTSRLTNRLGEQLRELVGEDFLSRIDRPEESGMIEGLKIIADTPLEFLRSNNLPLGLRFDCSRISPLPGNLSHQIATLQPIQLPLRAFDEVLILRSFLKNDPLRNILYDAIRITTDESKGFRTKVRFADICSEHELIEALNSFSGALVIFDCHGIYTGEHGVGALAIADKKINFWELKGKCNLPPIVMFSACDTQPIDGSHGSVATSAFSMGARAVLGTLLPITAPRAAIFIARLIVRLDSYLPAALHSRRHVTWREVVSGLLRMSHALEVMINITKNGGVKLSMTEISAIQFETTNYISARRTEWHDILIEQLAAKTLRSKEEIKKLIDMWCGLTEAMKYVHLGCPERIIITEN